MLSYLETVQKIAQSDVYNRGLKYYLDGKVLSHQDLVLDLWRKYKVSSNRIYEVQIPLLHLALSPKKFDKADLALLESVSCECGYFQEFGICKHIVAVCGSLENEFNINLKKNKRRQTESLASNVFDSILEVNLERKIRTFLIQFEDFLETGYKNINWFENFIIELKDDLKYKELLPKIKDFIVEKVEKYEFEKKILRLTMPSLRLDSKNWWRIWMQVLPHFTKENQLKFWQKAWESYTVNNLYEVENEFSISLKILDSELKNKILEKLQVEFEEDEKVWVDFVLKAEMQVWIEENLNLLDPVYLLKVIKQMPDIREKVEIHLLQQIKLWSDFLSTGQNYDEVVNVFKIWQNELGGSSYFEEALDYLKSNHPKKKKLFREI
jgi:SWIM zinc finger